MSFLHWFDYHPRLKELEAQLSRVGTRLPLLSVSRRTTLKRRVMQRVELSLAREEISFEQLSSELERLNLVIDPTPAFKQRARAHVFDVFALRGQQLWIAEVIKGFWVRKRMASFVVALLLLFVGTFGYLNQLPTVSAAKFSSATSVQGFVYLENGEGLSSLQPGDFLQEGDLIQTGGDGWAHLLFVDDTLLTLGPNTQVELTRLFMDPSNEAKTSIQVNVLKGRVWANVVNLLSNGSSFVVEVDGAQFFADRKATFDLLVTDTSVEVRSFDNLVNFDVTYGALVQEGTLGPNLSLHWDRGENLLLQKLASLEALVTEDVWIQTNLHKETDHLLSLNQIYQERWEDRTRFLPGENLYWLQRSFEGVQLWLTFDDDARSQRASQLADRRFSEAALLTSQGDLDEAEEAWEHYRLALAVFSEEFSYNAVQPLLDSNKKVMDLVSTNEDFFKARQEVEEASLSLAPDGSVKTVVQLKTAADRLGLALDLLDIGAHELALQSLQDYRAGLSQVIDQLSALELPERKEVIFEILDQKLYDLQLLKLIAARLPSSDPDGALQAEWDEVYGDTLYQLNALVLSLKERAVLQLTTFLKDVKGDSEIQFQVLARLKTSVPLEFEFIELINDLEALYAEESTEVLILNDSLAMPSSFDASFESEGLLFLGIPEDQEVEAN